MGTGIRIWIAALLAISLPLMASQLTQPRVSGSHYVFDLQGERNATYLIQQSTNLTDWETIQRNSGRRTNRVVTVTNALAQVSPQAFFRAVLTNAPKGYAILARASITLGTTTNASALVDSFDSSDPDYSTLARYDPAKRIDNAWVATMSSAPGAINAQYGSIWGSAVTAPGGAVVGNVGDGVWLTTTNGVQPLHVWDNFNESITNVALPTNTTWNTFPITRVLAGTSDYKHTGDLTLGFTVSPNARVRVWVTGDVKLIGHGDNIVISPGATLELYLAGSAADFGGDSGVANNSVLARACKIFGLPTCTSIRYISTASLIAVIYAPNASVKLRSDLSGSLTANSVILEGYGAVHYDEALNVAP